MTRHAVGRCVLHGVAAGMRFRLIQARGMVSALQLHALTEPVEAPVPFQDLEGLRLHAVQVPSAAPGTTGTEKNFLDDARPCHALLPGVRWPSGQHADWLACGRMLSPPARGPRPVQLRSAAALTWEQGPLPGQLGQPNWADPDPAAPGTCLSAAAVKLRALRGAPAAACCLAGLR